MSDFQTVPYESVSVGDELPALDVDLTTTMIIGAAIASRDFMPVHHDKGAAQAQGMGDVFMNILTTNGFVGRYVTDWAGTDAVLKNVAIKLGTPNLPGDTMKMRGKVEAKDDATGVVSVSVVGKNSWGDHVTGTVKLALPKGA